MKGSSFISAVNFELCIEEMNPRIDVFQTKTALNRFCIETNSIILNGNKQFTFVEIKLYYGHSCLRMFCNVVDEFLDDAIDDSLGLFWQDGGISKILKVQSKRMRTINLITVLVDGFYQSKIKDGTWHQIMRNTSDL